MGYKVKNTLSAIKALAGRLGNVLAFCWLPAVLAVIFVLQNRLFNFLIKIPAGQDSFRLVAATAASGLLIFGPAVLFRKRFKYPYLILVSLIVALIFAFQFLYYSYSGGFLQASALFYAREGTTVMATVKTLLNYRLVYFAIGPLLVALAWVLSRRGVIAERRPAAKEKLAAGLIVLVLAGSGYGCLFFSGTKTAGSADGVRRSGSYYDMNALVAGIGIINFFLNDVFEGSLRVKKVNAAETSFVESYEKNKTAGVSGSDFGALKGRNLILIQVESLENAVIGQKIGGEEITPNLNELAGRGLYFSDYYSPVGPGTTADAEFMTLNSLYSLPDGVAFIQYAYDDYDALPGLLRQNGYHAYCFHGDAASFWNRANIYPQLGYDEFFSRQDYTIPRKIGTYDLGDADFFEDRLELLAAESAVDRDRAALAGGERVDHGARLRDEVAASEDRVPFRAAAQSRLDRALLDRQRRGHDGCIYLLAYGGEDGVGVEDGLRPFDRDRLAPAGCVRLAELHPDAL